MSSEDASAIVWSLSGRYQQAGGLPGGVAAGLGPAGRARVDGCFDLMRALLDDCSLAEALLLIAGRARVLAGARTAFIALPAERADTLIVNVAVGHDAGNVLGLSVRTSRSVLGRPYTSRRPIASRFASGGSALPAGPVLMVPLDTGEATRGVLAVAGEPRGLSFSDLVRHQLLLFAASSATLIEMAEERRVSSRAAQTVTELEVRLRAVPPT